MDDKQTAEPVAWMYHHPGDLENGWQRFSFERRIQAYEGMSCNEEDAGIIETPLYTRPPATMPDAEIVEMLARVIRECGIQFRNYEMNHLAKCTPDGDAKAFRNKQMADKCAAALRNAGLIGDGR